MDPEGIKLTWVSKEARKGTGKKSGTYIILESSVLYF